MSNTPSTPQSDASALTLMTTLGTTTPASTLTISHTEGGFDFELVGAPGSRFECPICLLCLRDPVVTTCGHRFCSNCIRQWVVHHGGKCPVDSETLSPEKIFPDNYTRREIMASKAKCPYVKEGCTSVLAVDEMEKHIHTEHCSAVNGTITTNVFNGSHGEHVVECDYKYVGCDIRVPQVELQRHLEADVHHHLQLLQIAYSRLKIYSSSRSNLEYPSGPHDAAFWRQDSRDSTRWLLDDSPPDLDDYQFRRQRSWDSVRYARKIHARPRMTEGRLAESDESLCKPHSSGKGDSMVGVGGSGNSCGGVVVSAAEPHIKDVFERLVRLEQNDREKQIKIERLESELASAVKLFSTATQIIKDLTARYCHGVFVWKIPEFKRICLEMRCNPNHVLNSPGFYTDTFGYKLCLRFNLTTPSSSSSEPAAPLDLPLERDTHTFISLYVHFMQGEFDDTLRWPFIGEFKMIIIHPSKPQESITEIMESKPEAAAFSKPTLPRNPKGFGYPDICSISKVFSEGYVKNDTLVCKILAKALSD